MKENKVEGLLKKNGKKESCEMRESRKMIIHSSDYV